MSNLKDAAVKVIGLSNIDFATCHGDKTIRIWNLETKVQVQKLIGHSRDILALFQLKDGLLASGSCDKNIKIWNYTTGLLLNTLKGHTVCQ
jgi:WD40 repeat protein